MAGTELATPMDSTVFTDPTSWEAGRPGSNPEPESTDAEQPEWAFVRRAFMVPGLAYPLWHFAAPRGAIDPLWAWLAVGLGFLTIPLIHLFRPLSGAALRNAVSVLASVVTFHLFLLASINHMTPFFAVGSTVAVFATVLFIRSIKAMIAYAVFVGLLASILFALKPDGRKAAYWGGTIPVFLFAYSTLVRRLEQRRELEDQVRERTLQLSRANELLRNEIDERIRLEDELRVTHKMEAVGRLAGGVAHDFNNLVTTIGVYAELVMSGLLPESPLRKEVEQIQKATRQAAALTQQLLTLGRRSQVPLERIDLNSVISEAACMLGHLLTSRMDLKLELAPEPQYIWGNLDQIQQVLINLAINARDAMEQIGRLKIETARCSRAQLASRVLANGSSGGANASGDDPSAGLASDEYVLLAVEDDGVGMTAEARDRAFDPFFTTKDPGVGAGLGLSIVHGIVSQANGFVRVESELGRGTRFELYWPRAESEGEAAEPTWPRSAGGRQEEILLVEDEVDLREALRLALRTAGYRVTEAGDGDEALAIAASRPGGFDLLVTDVVMAGMNGFELARRMASEHPGTKVLLVSGHLSDRALADLSSDYPFLAKPFDASELTAKVRELLDACA